jgi:transcriptional regulator with XRE-family HTH domain
MTQTRKNKILPYHHKRLEKIGKMLKEMRFAEGLNQNDFVESGISRRQIQRGEYGRNITLVGLFKILDVYGYRLDEFFENME